MKDKIIAGLKESLRVKEELLKSQVEVIVKIVEAIIRALKDGGKVILFGNGGSAADAQHLAAELVGRFNLERKGLPALAFSTNTSILTSVGNDYSFAQVFARQVEALGRSEDVAIGISTSGKAANVIEGILAAKAKGIFTIGLTGGEGGKLSEVVDLTLIVPSLDTARIQEAHITVGHLICQLVEEELINEGTEAQRHRGTKLKNLKSCKLGKDMCQVVSRDELKEIVEKEKAAGKKIVFTNGCFDLVHVGHVRYLQEAKGKGDLLIVAVNSDQSVRKLKGEGRPLVPEKERAEIISAFASVDYVVIFPEETPAGIIDVLRPDILIKGGDYRKEDIVGRETVEVGGGEVITVSLSKGHSTRGFLEKIRKSDNIKL